MSKVMKFYFSLIGAFICVLAVLKISSNIISSNPTEKFIYCSRIDGFCSYNSKYLIKGDEIDNYISVSDINAVELKTDVEVRKNRYNDKLVNYDFEYGIAIKLKNRDDIILNFKTSDNEAIQKIVEEFQAFLNNPQQQEFSAGIDDNSVYYLLAIFAFLLILRLAANK